MSEVAKSIALVSTSLFNVPRIKLHFPTPRPLPAMTVFGMVFLSYFVIFSGVIYDVVNEVPAMGIKQDEMTGAQKPIAIMEGRLNGQYIIEGLAAGAMLARGSVGYITLNLAVDSGLSERNRNLTILVGLICVVASYLIIGMFLRMKVDKYSFYSKVSQVQSKSFSLINIQR